MRKLGDIITFDFTTHNPSTGMVQDADVLPTCDVFEDDIDIAILTPVVTNRVGKTGDYRVSIEATVGNGFEVGKTYNVVVLATVNAISAKSRIGVFVLDSKRNADMNDLSQAQILSDATPFQGGRIDEAISSRASQLTANDIKTETDKISAIKTETDKMSEIKDDTDLIPTIKLETDKIQPEIIAKKDEYKADVSSLALEATAQLVKDQTDMIPEIKSGVDELPTLSEIEASSILAKEVTSISIKDKTDLVPDVKIQTDKIPILSLEITSESIESKLDLVKTETDKIEPEIIDKKDEYKADISSLALEATSQSLKDGLDVLETLIGTIDTSDELKARFDEIKGAGWIDETLKTMKDTVDSLDLELDGVAKESTLNEKASQLSVDAVKIDTASIVSTLSTLVADMWAYTARTLSSFGNLAADVWGNLTRTLTAGTKDTEIDAIKLETDKIQSEIIDKKGEYKADVSALALESTTQLIKEELELIKSQTNLITDIDAAIVGLTDDMSFLLACIRNKKYLAKTGDIWYLVIRDSNDTVDMLRKPLKDKSGNNISDILAGVLAAELKSEV